ncbi:MAG: hypothetical protein JST54_16740 [Deltaproteobacteria bacterium]|nr:hypothetical protein [Deltaproteobacteria bacterium]
MKPVLAGIAGALLLAACGTSREIPDGGPIPDSGPTTQPLAPIFYNVGFASSGIVINDDGNFLAVSADAGVTLVLDADGLGTDDEATLPTTGVWQPLLTRTGPGGRSDLLNADGTIFSLDLVDAGGLVYAQLSPPPRSFAMRRDAEGVVAIVPDAGVQLLNSTGALVQTFALPAGTQADDIAADGAGRYYAALNIDGGCAGIAVLADAGGGELSHDFGGAPCAVTLSNDNTSLWLTAQVDGGATLYHVHARQLPDPASLLGSWPLPGVFATQVLVSGDDGVIAVLGQAPGNTLAMSREAALVGGGPLPTVPASEIQSAVGAVFDDSDALYIADPLQQTIDVVR